MSYKNEKNEKYDKFFGNNKKKDSGDIGVKLRIN